MTDKLPEEGDQYEDRRGNRYTIITLCRDVQTDEQIVVYKNNISESCALCCPLDAFNVSMKLVKDEGVAEEKEKDLRLLTAEDRLLAFLDTDDFSLKSVILKEMYIRNEINDHMIDNMAAAIDVVINEGNIQSRYDELASCVDIRARYETTRLRRNNII